MVRCSHQGCGWTAIAPSAEAGWAQYAAHLVEAHAASVDADVPAGMVQVKLEAGGEWITTTVEEAAKLHARVHGE